MSNTLFLAGIAHPCSEGENLSVVVFGNELMQHKRLMKDWLFVGCGVSCVAECGVW